MISSTGFWLHTNDDETLVADDIQGLALKDSDRVRMCNRVDQNQTASI
jgi:hypothetical protein